MKQIPLSQQGKNKGKYFALVDDEDYDFLIQWRWCSMKDRNTFYVHRSDYNLKKTFFMHRIIMKINNPQILIDHKDCNGLNNQKNNLRICNHSQNAANSPKSNKNSSIYKGVYKKKNGRYVSYLKKNQKVIFFRTFDSEIEAAKAYDIMAMKYFGEFANLNFPKE